MDWLLRKISPSEALTRATSETLDHKTTMTQPVEQTEAPATVIEFAVQLQSQKDVDDVTKTLNDLGISVSEVDQKSQKVVVTTSLPSTRVHAAIANTGRQAVVRGCSAPEGANLGTAVCMILGEKGTSEDMGAVKSSATAQDASAASEPVGMVRGLVRFVQVSEDVCVVDGAASGLQTGTHGVRVNTYGDLTDGCSSTEPVYTDKVSGEAIGNLGDVEADTHGHTSFKFVARNLRVWDIIGRAVVIDSSSLKDTQEENKGSVACGLIARSAGVGENIKKVCACSGKTLWEEGADEYY
ncbi:hypothetical protein SARC_08029 [Sphaeroforma arctica JP610]|uniref:Superoxide dismutase copper/zinc binding domain-containing protein n=1 Tax=Sphaeroforma arctica JP610 TaxID=667725 RepID=A0A0L0FSN3_9EUKA|nr:hypothetical protein SARC_08029 [Sphaeroforma arctica JP610]KNC79581.1 hypothetical protein SARC_08029 [Sphaeroforma arctica JP610]|eukprot:XP_014153483.1 hypothetical protein SARC_08029 [Sphaeroforma arctica JP610]